MAIPHMRSLAGVLVVSVLGGGARAELTFGEPLIAPFDAAVGLEFVSSSAGWRGEVRWIPPGPESLGTLAFVNKEAQAGDALEMVGLVKAGEALPLAYNVTTGVPALYRMTDPETAGQFAWEWLGADRARVLVEDIALPGGDADFNDVVFDVTFGAVPEPASIALGFCGLAAWARRRR